MLKYIMFYDILMTISIMFYFGSTYCVHCKLSDVRGPSEQPSSHACCFAARALA